MSAFFFLSNDYCWTFFSILQKFLRNALNFSFRQFSCWNVGVGSSIWNNKMESRKLLLRAETQSEIILAFSWVLAKYLYCKGQSPAQPSPPLLLSAGPVSCSGSDKCWEPFNTFLYWSVLVNSWARLQMCSTRLRCYLFQL